MEKVALVELIEKKFGETVSVAPAGDAMPVVEVESAGLLGLMQKLKEDPDLLFDYMISLAGMDYGEKRGVVYHMRSTSFLHQLVVKCSVPAEKTEIASVVSLWPCADWYEREAFDMFGIVFDGHPCLTRLLLPEDWEGHPLLKDYVYPDSYDGIPHKEIDCDVQ